MRKNPLKLAVICLLTLMLICGSAFCLHIQQAAADGGDSSKNSGKQLSPKDSQFQEDAAKQLNNIAKGVNDSFKENQNWFTSFIEKLKNQDFFKSIGEFIHDILAWFAKIFKDIAEALQPDSWKKYIQDIEDSIRGK